VPKSPPSNLFAISPSDDKGEVQPTRLEPSAYTNQCERWVSDPVETNTGIESPSISVLAASTRYGFPYAGCLYCSSNGILDLSPCPKVRFDLGLEL